jgi:hypothetical protein
VTISNEAASRIAKLSAADTMMTGAFIDPRSRRTSPGLVVRKLAMALGK